MICYQTGLGLQKSHVEAYKLRIAHDDSHERGLTSPLHTTGAGTCIREIIGTNVCYRERQQPGPWLNLYRRLSGEKPEKI